MGNQQSYAVAAAAVADGSYSKKVLKSKHQHGLISYAVEREDWELLKDMLDTIRGEKTESKESTPMRDFKVAKILSEVYQRKPHKVLSTAFESDYGPDLYKTIFKSQKNSDFPQIFRETAEDVLLFDLGPELICKVAFDKKGTTKLSNTVFNVFWAKFLFARQMKNRVGYVYKGKWHDYFMEVVEDPENAKHMCAMNDEQYSSFSELLTHGFYVKLQVKQLHTGVLKQFFEIRPIPDEYKIDLKDYKNACSFNDKYKYSFTANLRMRKDYDKLSLNAKKYLFSEFNCINKLVREFLFDDEELAQFVMFLHTAVQSRRNELIKLLLDNGVDITLCDSKGKMAYEYASDSIPYDLYKRLVPGHHVKRKRVSKISLSVSESDDFGSECSAASAASAASVASSKKRVSFIEETSDTGITSHSE